MSAGLVALEPAQAALTDRILAGELIREAELREAGAIRPEREDVAAGGPGSAVEKAGAVSKAAPG